MEWIAVIFFGFILGLKHSTDADHIVAVSTIVSQQKKLTLASMVGVMWGIGHTFTILIIGSAIIYLKLTISPFVGLFMEFAVGVMIVILGLLSLKKVVKLCPSAEFKQGNTHGVFKSLLLRPLMIGLVHGMAGSAAVAILVLSAIPNQIYAVFYFIIFGLGTMIGMMLVTMIIGLPYIYSWKLNHFNRFLGLATAAFSIGFGFLLMYDNIQSGLSLLVVP